MKSPLSLLFCRLNNLCHKEITPPQLPSSFFSASLCPSSSPWHGRAGSCLDGTCGPLGSREPAEGRHGRWCLEALCWLLPPALGTSGPWQGPGSYLYLFATSSFSLCRGFWCLVGDWPMPCSLTGCPIEWWCEQNIGEGDHQCWGRCIIMGGFIHVTTGNKGDLRTARRSQGRRQLKFSDLLKTEKENQPKAWKWSSLKIIISTSGFFF